MAKTLKIGSKFKSECVVGDSETELTLYDVIIDDDGEKWAIGLNHVGEPFIVLEGDIDTEVTETEILLPGKAKKNG